MNKIVYKIVAKWVEPTYYDYDTNERLYDEYQSSPERLWVVSYDPEEKEIVEWLKEFSLLDEQQARDYIKQLEENNN